MLVEHIHPSFKFAATTFFVVGLMLLGRPGDVIFASSIYTPSINSYHISTAPYGSEVTPISLTAGTTTRYYVTGTITDLDGWNDILYVNSRVYRSGVYSFCATDNNSCYYPSCNITGSGTTANFSCPVDLHYYADSTDAPGKYPSENWRVFVDASDSAFYYTSKDTYSTEVESLSALSTSSGMDFGNLALGQTSVTSQSMQLWNEGNVDISVQLYTDGMTCTSGSIPASNQHYSFFNTGYSSMPFAMSVIATTPGIYIYQRTNDFFASATDLFYRIQVPNSGVGGTCSGTNYYNPIAL